MRTRNTASRIVGRKVVTEFDPVAAAKAAIIELEGKQARRVRELLAGSDPRLKAIDDEIYLLRSSISETGTSESPGERS